MLVASYSPKATHNITFLDNYTNIFIEDAILRVPGVGDVNARTDNFSYADMDEPGENGFLQFDAQRCFTALNAQNVYVAAGSVGAPPQESSQTHEYRHPG